MFYHKNWKISLIQLNVKLLEEQKAEVFSLTKSHVSEFHQITHAYPVIQRTMFS